MCEQSATLIVPHVHGYRGYVSGGITTSIEFDPQASTGIPQLVLTNTSTVHARGGCAQSTFLSCPRMRL